MMSGSVVDENLAVDSALVKVGSAGLRAIRDRTAAVKLKLRHGC